MLGQQFTAGEGHAARAREIIHQTPRTLSRATCLIVGKLFTISIHEEIADIGAAEKRLDELAAAANDIALGDEAFRQMPGLPFVIDNEESPRAICGFNRSNRNPDIRVTLYPPHEGVQLR